MTLERYKRKRVKAIGDEYTKCMNRNGDIILATILTLAYDKYHQAQLNRICAESRMTYHDAERSAETFNDIFGTELPTDAFLPDTEKRVNAAIVYYQEYKKQRDSMPSFGYEAEDLDTFCKMLFHQPWYRHLTWFVANNSTGYVYAMRGVYEYVMGNVSFEQMKMCFKTFMPPQGLRDMSDTEVRMFVRTMFRLVAEFKDHVDLRRARKNNVRAYKTKD